jgi:hypothetical protein
MADVKIYKSATFVTAPFRATFPHLAEVDRFGSYGVDLDVLANPDIWAIVEANAAETLTAAHAEIGTDKAPTNKIVKDGEYKGDAWRRAAFKMKGTKSVKGKEIQVSPQIVDANRKPFSGEIFGGSLIQVAYFLQFTLMPTGTYLSLKLAAVQVIELVGPGGGVNTDTVFDVVAGGFSGEVATEETPQPVDPSAAELDAATF